MPNYKKIDLESWPRKEHYAYYTENLKVEYNITVNMQVDSFLEFCHSHHYRFFPALICLFGKVIHDLDAFRMFKNDSEELCIWDFLNPSYTIFHEDDHTFSDCWSAYDDDFDHMYQNLIHDMETYKDVKGIKARKDQPANFFCISCVPWLHFASYSARVSNSQPQFFPVFTIGKYETENGKTWMPVNMVIAHAVCDGYHASLFFNTLQKELDNMK